ncbi:MAG: hypothetical protein HC836_25870, partial [Richelia sp. RM2_1_2]|nr:hypothetical protein [Richelia sp. RM2_1_2]
MNKFALLAGVAAIALFAGFNDANACSGNSCTPVNTNVSGNALATGKAFEAAGVVSFGTHSASAGVSGIAGSKSTAGLTRDVNCTTGCITGNASTVNYAGYQAVGTGDAQTITASYTGTGGNIYIYDSNSFNLYKIVVTGPGASDLVLGVDDFKSAVSTNVRAIGSRIYVSNVK